MKLMGLLLMSLFSVSVYAGGAPVVLKCVSDSGLTEVKSYFPGDYLGTYVNYSIYSEEVVMADEYYSDSKLPEDTIEGLNYDVTDRRKSVSILVTDSDEKVVFKLESLSSGFVYKSTDFGHRKEFRATVKGVDPREEKGGEDSPLIYVNCTYVYEV